MSTTPIFLVHAANTPVRPEVFEAMLPYRGLAAFGSPWSAHRYSRIARRWPSRRSESPWL